MELIQLVHRIVTASLQKGGVPAAPSGTATLLRLSPNYQFYPRTLLAVTYFRYPRLSWLDGRERVEAGRYRTVFACQFDIGTHGV